MDLIKQNIKHNIRINIVKNISMYSALYGKQINNYLYNNKYYIVFSMKIYKNNKDDKDVLLMMEYQIIDVARYQQDIKYDNDRVYSLFIIWKDNKMIKSGYFVDK